MGDVVEIPTSPGLVSAMVFILFDIFLLTWLDGSLGRLMNAFYYRRIVRHGDAFRVQSCDMPCVTNFLVGSRLALINYPIILLKVGILATMFFLDLSIKSRSRNEKSTLILMSTYGFNLSEAVWGMETSDSMRYNIEWRWADVRECRVVEQRGDMYNVTFYALGFNLSNDFVQDGRKDNISILPLNLSTLTCLKPGLVQEPVVTAIVRGCSHFRNGPCHFALTKRVKIDLNPYRPSYQNAFYFSIKDPPVYFMGVDYPFEIWQHAFSSYAAANGSFTCVHSIFKSPRLNTAALPMMCMFVVQENQTTLVEMWQYSASSKMLWRNFPGPVIEGEIDIGRIQRIAVLINVFRQMNWIDLSSVLVANGAVYNRFTHTTFTQLGTAQTITTIPYSSIIVTAVLFVIIVGLRLGVASTFSDDHRPQLNTIDGLSSIAREETIPTGSSLRKGSTSFVGLRLSKDGMLRFGPLIDPSLAVRPIKDVDMI